MDTNWVEPVVQLTDADFCKIFNRESQLGREEGGDSPFWKVKEDFEDLGFRLFGLACRHICQTHISVFTSQSHARLDHSRLILRHWQFHDFLALEDSPVVDVLRTLAMVHSLDPAPPRGGTVGHTPGVAQASPDICHQCNAPTQ